MQASEIKIVKLQPAHMLSFYGYGPEPENLAWSKLAAWVQKNQFQLDPEKNRVFGFNNPCPSVGSTKYGYEYWLTCDAAIQPEGEVRINEFSGGLYAVLPCTVKSGEELPALWKSLNLWVETSPYSPGQHQWLEEHSPEGLPIALYLPVTK